MSNVMSLPSVGPYVGVSEDKIVKPKGSDRELRLLLYGAYNALGLVSTGYNGVAILDETNNSVLTDGLWATGSGYNGPSREQKDMFKQLCDMSWEEIRLIINSSGRCRDTV